MDDAACRDDAAPEVFFTKDASTAKVTCLGCEVATTCLRYAIENDIEHGTWGGLDEDERKAISRRVTRPRPGFTRGDDATG